MPWLTRSGASTFTELSDVPNSYAGQANKVVAVNVDETALEFVDGGGGGGFPAEATQENNDAPVSIISTSTNTVTGDTASYSFVADSVNLESAVYFNQFHDTGYEEFLLEAEINGMNLNFLVNEGVNTSQVLFTVDPVSSLLQVNSSVSAGIVIDAPIQTLTMNADDSGTFAASFGSSAPVADLTATHWIPFVLNGVEGYIPFFTDANPPAETWLPTGTILANVSALTPSDCIFSRDGNVVSFSGRVSFTPTNPALEADFTLTLPIPTMFTTTSDASGVVVRNTTTAGRFSAVVGAATIRCFVIGPAGSNFCIFSGQYIVK